MSFFECWPATIQGHPLEVRWTLSQTTQLSVRRPHQTRLLDLSFSSSSQLRTLLFLYCSRLIMFPSAVTLYQSFYAETGRPTLSVFLQKHSMKMRTLFLPLASSFNVNHLQLPKLSAAQWSRPQWHHELLFAQSLFQFKRRTIFS